MANAEYTWSATHPLVGAGVVDTVSDYKRVSLRLSDWVARTRSDSFRVRLAMDATDASQTATQFATTLYDDRVRVVRVGLDWNSGLASLTQVSAGLDLSHGVHGLGSRGPAQAATGAPLSQQQASDVFTKSEARVQIHQLLPARLGLDIAVRGQYTGGAPLLSSEKFSIGGPADLSAADASSISGDRGWAARAELQWQTAVNTQTDSLPPTQLYAFAAHGHANTLDPTVAQPAVVSLTDYGVGAPSNAHLGALPSLPLDLDLELAQQSSKTPGLALSGVRVRVAVTLHF